MASIPGAQISLTGASGSQGLLSPKASWRCYVVPRGAFASQDSTGALITFDSAAVASRFAASDWIQVGLATANVRQVSAVGGNSISVGTAVTVSENDRVYIIGTTEPTVVGGSATYIPATTIRQRDDDAADVYTNSMVTSTTDGLIQFFTQANYYDAIVQDGNQANQGSIIDLTVGAVEGISTSQASVFGATVTINAALGVTGTVDVTGDVDLVGGVSMTGSVDVEGPTWLHRQNSTKQALGVTGFAEFHQRVSFGNSVSIDGALGVTGTATLAGLTVSGSINVPNMTRCRAYPTAANQTVGSTTVFVVLDAEAYDVGGMHDPVTNNTRLTIPSGADGLYTIQGFVEWSIAGSTGTGRLGIDFLKNGAAVGITAGYVLSQVIGDSQYGTLPTQSFSTVLGASTGNYFEMRAFQDLGSNVLIIKDVSFFQMNRIG